MPCVVVVTYLCGTQTFCNIVEIVCPDSGWMTAGRDACCVPVLSPAFSSALAARSYLKHKLWCLWMIQVINSIHNVSSIG